MPLMLFFPVVSKIVSNIYIFQGTVSNKVRNSCIMTTQTLLSSLVKWIFPPSSPHRIYGLPKGGLQPESKQARVQGSPAQREGQ